LVDGGSCCGLLVSFLGGMMWPAVTVFPGTCRSVAGLLRARGRESRSW
jgi:hypothetical protein